MGTVKIYHVADDFWIAAESPQQARDFYLAIEREHPEEAWDEPIEVSQDDMRQMTLTTLTAAVVDEEVTLAEAFEQDMDAGMKAPFLFMTTL